MSMDNALSIYPANMQDAACHASGMVMLLSGEETTCFAEGAGYPGLRRFFDEVLPHARLQVLRSIAPYRSLPDFKFQFYLDDSILPFYIANHLIDILPEIEMTIVISSKIYPLGGPSLYARSHPLLMRRLMIGLLRAQSMSVADGGVDALESLHELLPKHVRSFKENANGK